MANKIRRTCPFCGRILEWRKYVSARFKKCYVCVCGECNAEGIWEVSKEQVNETWRRRADDGRE